MLMVINFEYFIRSPFLGMCITNAWVHLVGHILLEQDLLAYLDEELSFRTSSCLISSLGIL